MKSLLLSSKSILFWCHLAIDFTFYLLQIRYIKFEFLYKELSAYRPLFITGKLFADAQYVIMKD